jgi:GNAT superfamily N-acetyltransferase
LEEITAWLNSRGVGQVPSRIYRDSADYFSESIAGGEVYFAVIRDEIVGSLRLLSEDRIVWPEADDRAFYLYNLLVRRNLKGQGLGRQLLAWAESQTIIAGKDYLRLDCFANNAILRRYYENAGYADRGEVDARYPFGTLRLQRYEKHVQA